jgi:GntR family transcriptional regulator
MTKNGAVRSYLEDLLQSELQVGDPIPSERTLAMMFGVARMTARVAVDGLVADGRLRRVRPLGTFVSVPSPGPLGGTGGAVTEVIESSGEPHYRVLAAEMIDASEEVASALALGVGDRVEMVRRVRLAGEEPLAVESIHVPAGLWSTRGSRGQDRPVDVLIASQYGIRVDEGSEVIAATTLTSCAARTLHVPDGSPGLMLRRVSFAARKPVAFSVSTYRADRCRLLVEFPRATGL